MASFTSRDVDMTDDPDGQPDVPTQNAQHSTISPSTTNPFLVGALTPNASFTNDHTSRSSQYVTLQPTPPSSFAEQSYSSQYTGLLNRFTSSGSSYVPSASGVGSTQPSVGLSQGPRNTPFVTGLSPKRQLSVASSQSQINTPFYNPFVSAFAAATQTSVGSSQSRDDTYGYASNTVAANTEEPSTASKDHVKRDDYGLINKKAKLEDNQTNQREQDGAQEGHNAEEEISPPLPRKKPRPKAIFGPGDPNILSTAHLDKPDTPTAATGFADLNLNDEAAKGMSHDLSDEIKHVPSNLPGYVIAFLKNQLDPELLPGSGKVHSWAEGAEKFSEMHPPTDQTKQADLLQNPRALAEAISQTSSAFTDTSGPSRMANSKEPHASAGQPPNANQMLRPIEKMTSEECQRNAGQVPDADKVMRPIAKASRPSQKLKTEKNKTVRVKTEPGLEPTATTSNTSTFKCSSNSKKTKVELYPQAQHRNGVSGPSTIPLAVQEPIFDMRPASSYDPFQNLAYRRTNDPDFNIFSHGILRQPDIFFHFASILPVKDFVSLYAISKRFHRAANQRFTTIILTSAFNKVPDSATCFPFRAYGHLSVPDPKFAVPVARRLGKDPETYAVNPSVRRVPSLKWLQMVLWREKVVQEILAIMAEDGCPLPLRTALALKKIWLCMDVPANGRRVGYFHNPAMVSDLDIFFGTMFIVKLDQRFTDPLAEDFHDGLRRLCFAQRSLSYIWKVLKGLALKNELDVIKEFIKWRYVPSNPAERHLNVFGIPSHRLGRGCLENWGMPFRNKEGLWKIHPPTRHHVMVRPDQLIQRESLRRKLRMKNHFLRMLLWGYIDTDKLRENQNTDPQIDVNLDPEPRLWPRRAPWIEDEYSDSEEVGAPEPPSDETGIRDPLLDLGPIKPRSRFIVQPSALTNLTSQAHLRTLESQTLDRLYRESEIEEEATDEDWSWLRSKDYDLTDSIRSSRVKTRNPQIAESEMDWSEFERIVEADEKTEELDWEDEDLQKFLRRELGQDNTTS